jgi:hypothetical protein
MRTYMVLTAIVLVAAAEPAGAPGWPDNTILRAQICVERPGDTGRLNLRPADVIIQGGPGLRLIGEQAACAYVQGGTYRMWAQSSNPFDSSSTNPEAWKSATVTVTVRQNERVEVEVCGLGANGAYTNWRVERVGGRCK